jgi:hypothetical protein
VTFEDNPYVTSKKSKPSENFALPKRHKHFTGKRRGAG